MAGINDDPERRRAYQRDRRAAETPGQREERLTRVRAWHQRNRAQQRQYMAEYRTGHADELVEKKAEYYAANKDEIRDRQAARRGMTRREWNLLNSYGLTGADYDRMLAEQDGKCAVCGTKPTAAEGRHDVLHVDHDHATGQNRGLLCAPCNRGLGHFRDNPDLMLAAAAYLLRKQDLLSVLAQEV